MRILSTPRNALLGLALALVLALPGPAAAGGLGDLTDRLQGSTIVASEQDGRSAGSPEEALQGLVALFQQLFQGLKEIFGQLIAAIGGDGGASSGAADGGSSAGGSSSPGGSTPGATSGGTSSSGDGGASTGSSGTPGDTSQAGNDTAGGTQLPAGSKGPKALHVWLQQAGLSGERLRMAWAIAMGESGGDPRAFNGNSRTGDKSYGLFQINMIGNLGPARRKEFGISSNEELFNPQVNIKAMLKVSSNCTNWKPWSVYKNGTYKKFLSQYPPK